MDIHRSVVIEAPMGTETIVVKSDGKVKRIPIVNNQIDWKAFEEAVNKINKLKAREGVFIPLEEARKRRNYDKFIEADIHSERPTPNREGHDCSENHGEESR